MQLLFSTETGAGSAIIRAFTWSPWSHVDLVFGQDIIGAYPGVGVERINIMERIGAAKDWALFDVPGLEDAAALKCAMAELNKPYDWRGVFGVGLHRDWQSKDKWFCSELAAYVAQACNLPLLNGDYKRITPGMLAMSPILKAAKK